ncbi:MAG: hypothetical protein SGJ27_21925 [Candidatus Melainabacteria bacterium]|nr:hypothetical protein [Candidatus Melainabacteria bacterium]
MVKSKLGNVDGAKKDLDQSIRLNPDATSHASHGSEECPEMPMFVS